MTILEGESLVNDATALVTYRFAAAAVLSGSFSLAGASARFVIASVGGVLFGLFVGWIVGKIHARLDDPPVQVTIALLTPFAEARMKRQEHGYGLDAKLRLTVRRGFR